MEKENEIGCWVSGCWASQIDIVFMYMNMHMFIGLNNMKACDRLQEQLTSCTQDLQGFQSQISFLKGQSNKTHLLKGEVNLPLCYKRASMNVSPSALEKTKVKFRKNLYVFFPEKSNKEINLISSFSIYLSSSLLMRKREIFPISSSKH